MRLDPESCYRALATHDARFDGRFFVGVATTGIYCRPICTVRSPRRENCRFFPSAAAAERDGYRPCLRCRPEQAPGNAGIDSAARLSQAAAALIEDGFLDLRGIDALAARIGVTDRHLRRIFVAEFGASPVAYAQTQRLLLAKRLLTDTALPMTDVASASGFSSVRRFNALFRARYRMVPSRLRANDAGLSSAEAIVFRLAYRPPYAWETALSFLRDRAIEGVEAVDATCYRRTIALAHRGARHAGAVAVTHRPRANVLEIRIGRSLAPVLPQVLGRIKQMFDLGCDPGLIAAALSDLVPARAGLRVIGTFDGFEAVVRAVVGQQISVRAARTVLGRIAAVFGAPIADGAPAGLTIEFPDAQRLAGVDAADLAALGMTGARARSIIGVAQAIVRGDLDVSRGADIEKAIARLVELPGIGPWTAQYVAMRALGWPDAFPHPDLGVMKAMRETRPARALERSAAWRPWRAYAVMHFWTRTP